MIEATVQFGRCPSFASHGLFVSRKLTYVISDCSTADVNKYARLRNPKHLPSYVNEGDSPALSSCSRPPRDPLLLRREFNMLSLADLLAPREKNHVELMGKNNLVGTAAALYLETRVDSEDHDAVSDFPYDIWHLTGRSTSNMWLKISRCELVFDESIRHTSAFVGDAAACEVNAC